MPPARAKVLVQPQSWRSSDSGLAAATAPSWPIIPVSWVMKGACLTRNHRTTSRRSEVKTIASPQPSSIRARTPEVKLSAKANHSCAAVMRTSPPRSSGLLPKRSRSTPTGTCIAA